MTNAYIESRLAQTPANASVVGYIKRPDGRILTSAMLGAMEATPKAYCTLSSFLDVALATLSIDSTVTISFPEVPR